MSPTATMSRRSTKPQQPFLPMPAVLYDATEAADVVSVPARTVLMIENQGAPESAVFQESVGAVYGLAYTLKFARKRSLGRDFKIGPLEARWWVDDTTRRFDQVPRAEWHWQLRLAMPDDVTPAELAATVTAATTKKGAKLEGSAAARRATIEHLRPARFGRVLHVGPYAAEARSFAKIVCALEAEGITPGNRHVEVYLNDPRRTKPEGIRTVLLLET